jgi:hypothetical protein
VTYLHDLFPELLWDNPPCCLPLSSTGSLFAEQKLPCLPSSITVTARLPMFSFHVGAPTERVHLDFIGSLPRTEQGNEHILMMVDQFTKCRGTVRGRFRFMYVK